MRKAFGTHSLRFCLMAERHHFYSLIFLLFIRVKLIKLPANRIFADIIPMLLVICKIADDVIMRTRLPNVFAVFFVAKSLEG